MDLQTQKKEFIKCSDSCEYYLEGYGKVKHPIRGIVPFKLYDFQRETLNAFQDHRFTIILKARQLGLSTLMAGYISWLMVFNANVEILVISIKREASIKFVNKIKLFMKELPDFLRPELTSDNKLSVDLANGSVCTASTSSEEAGRGEALTLLVLDEAAFIHTIKDLWTAAWPTLSTGGNAVALSTPNGQGNWFHKTYMDAESGLNDFYPIELMWYLHPERDQKWYDITLKGLNNDKKKMAQEYECDFITSGNTVVDGEVIQWYKENMRKDPKKKFGPARSIWRWADPIPEHRYIVTADTARGDGSDFSAYQVIDIDTLEQVEEFKYQISVQEFAKLLIAAATTYNKALLAIENNALGWSTVVSVMDRGYTNIYYSEKIGAQKKNPYDVVPESKKVAGFTTSTRVRPLMIDELANVCKEKELKIYSKRLLDELTVFIWYFGKAGAMEDYNDDAVISLAMALYLLSDGLRTAEIGPESYEVDYSTYAETMAPMIEGPAIPDPYKDPDFGDLRWLLEIDRG